MVQTAKFPHSADLMSESTSEDDNKYTDINGYLSLTMKLMYLAKKTRPDILFTVSYLATKGKIPTQGNYNKLLKVLRYINNSKDIQLILKPTDFSIHLYVDASFATHPDARCQSGTVLNLSGKGSCAIFSSSNKQRLVAKSSTEAELIALNDGLSTLEWLSHLVSELGYSDLPPPTVHEDNISTIIMSKQGFNSAGKSKHINIRYFYVKQLIDEDRIKLVHISTEDQTADILTKPLTGESFLKLRSKLDLSTGF